MAMAYTEILRTYEGSNGDATMALYRELQGHGAAGHIAVNVFRAMKASERAKVYRGGERGADGRTGRSYRDMASDRKRWAIDNLVKTLLERAEDLGIGWGWARNRYLPTLGCEWVLHIDLPTGQVSIDCGDRGAGPDFEPGWDDVIRAGPPRIARWCEQVLGGGAQ